MQLIQLHVLGAAGGDGLGLVGRPGDPAARGAANRGAAAAAVASPASWSRVSSRPASRSAARAAPARSVLELRPAAADLGAQFLGARASSSSPAGALAPAIFWLASAASARA